LNPLGAIGMIRFLPEPAPRRYSMAKRILVVDDDENILNLEKTILEQKGFDVTGAGGGAEALKVLEDRVFDLVLLDVMMPEVDGFAAGTRWRKGSSPAPSCTSTSPSPRTSC
jgi:DNA-binding response OmpR family regulator